AHLDGALVVGAAAEDLVEDVVGALAAAPAPAPVSGAAPAAPGAVAVLVPAAEDLVEDVVGALAAASGAVAAPAAPGAVAVLVAVAEELVEDVVDALVAGPVTGAPGAVGPGLLGLDRRVGEDGRRGVGLAGGARADVVRGGLAERLQLGPPQVLHLLLDLAPGVHVVGGPAADLDDPAGVLGDALPVVLPPDAHDPPRAAVG